MRRPTLENGLVLALLACTLVLGVTLRLQDPLSTRALGAEDPYTHVVFIKEWLAQGYFADSFNLGTGMYPPGMHAFVGAFAPLAGVPLYDFARIAPALFGALSILGMFALGQRLSGNVAGVAAAFLTAIMPEVVFRTELLFPTALDLALLPLWLLGFHLATSGHRVEGTVLFLGASVPLAIMHPWLVPLFAAPLGLYLAFRTLRGKLAPELLRHGALMLVPPVAFAMAFRWSESDTGFADFFAKIVPALATLDVPRPLLFVALLLLFGALALGVAWGLAQLARVRVGRGARFVVGALIGVALLAAVPFLGRSPPFEVDYREMIGPFAIALGLAGLLVAFLRPTPLGDMAASIAIVLFPLTALDLFDSPFWPQRTVAYLCVGVALLGASAVANLHELPQRFTRTGAPRRAWIPAALVAVSLVAAGGAVATRGDGYKWYRLYNEEHFAGFEQVARQLEKDDDSRVFIYTWQPALMVKTLTDPAHVWYSPEFFSDGAKRSQQLGDVDGPAYVLVDKHTLAAEKEGDASLGFLQDGSKYRKIYSSSDSRLQLYEVL